MVQAKRRSWEPSAKAGGLESPGTGGIPISRVRVLNMRKIWETKKYIWQAQGSGPRIQLRSLLKWEKIRKVNNYLSLDTHSWEQSWAPVAKLSDGAVIFISKKVRVRGLQNLLLGGKTETQRKAWFSQSSRAGWQQKRILQFVICSFSYCFKTVNYRSNGNT
jgi:hypothetical protein